jgi:multiple sugar transport system permease protein
VNTNFRKITGKSVPFLFIAPSFILLVIFSIFPIFVALGISFTNLNLAGLADYSKIQFVLFDNYKELITDSTFIKSISNTIYYVLIGVPCVIFFSLLIAFLINFGTTYIFQMFRVVFYMPTITNIVAIAVIWGYLYNSKYGFFNQSLSLLDIAPIGWLENQNISKISLIILAVWRSTGLNMIIFLTALQGVPKDYYEAASIDGVNGLQKLWYITLPLLKYSIFFVTVTTLIGWLQFFEEPLVMTNGGPLDSTTSMALFIYTNGFKRSNFGYASAGSFVLFICIILVTIIQFKLKNKED